MFDTIEFLADDVKAVIRRCREFSIEKIPALTDTARGPKNAIETRALQEQARELLELVRAKKAEPSYKDLDPALKANLDAIEEEYAAGVDEVDEHVHPDKLFPRLPHQTKLDITQSVPVDIDAVARFRARFSGDLRKQRAQPPAGNPPGKNK